MKGLIHRWRRSGRTRLDLDALLAHAAPQLPIAERVEWLVELLIWLRTPGQATQDSGSLPAVRLRFLLQVLERHPDWKKSVAHTLRSLVRDLEALDLFSQTGLPMETGFVSEVSERLLRRFLPEAPRSSDFGELFGRLFPEGHDLLWLERLDHETLGALILLFSYDLQETEDDWNSLERDMERALVVLASDLRSLALSPALRRRLGQDRFEDFPFVRLLPLIEKLLSCSRTEDAHGMLDVSVTVRGILADCSGRIRHAFHDLGDKGVSIDLVYRLDRMQAQIERSRRLVSLLVEERADVSAHLQLLKDLVRAQDEQRSLRAFFSETFSLLSRKIAERSADTGEHYIARDAREHRALIGHALGGGALTAFTTLGKILLEFAPMASFVKGALASMNYASSFLLIQAFGFTLATKQPAMTAPALAARMENLDDEASMRALVEEVVRLVRSQGAAIMGNLVAVVPLCFLLDYLSLWLFGDRILDPKSAREMLREHSLLGFSPLFAAFTGVLLWASSIISGWVDNASAYRRVPEGLAHNRRLIFFWGRSGAQRFAAGFRRHLSGIAGNVSLGLLLGLFPKVLAFFGLGLEVRHVTLATGTVAFCLSALGRDAFRGPEATYALAGILVIGLLNVGVAFFLALFVALRARKVRSVDRRRVYRALARRLFQRPWSFVWPDHSPNS